MTKTFECPSCGGPLDLPQDGSPAIRCSNCGRTIVVPFELREDPPAWAFGSPESVGSDLLREIDRLIAAGNKIAAVKQRRGRTTDRSGGDSLRAGFQRLGRSVRCSPQPGALVQDQSVKKKDGLTICLQNC